MKYQSTLNLFWAIVWAVVLIFAIIAYWWKPAIFIVALNAAVMFGMFLHDYIRIIRMK